MVNIKDMLLPRERVFMNNIHPKWIVIHKTGGGSTLQALHDYFLNNSEMKSSHFGIDTSGNIARFVNPMIDGACANCCSDNTGLQFLQDFNKQNGNLNWFTISIEHIDIKADNSSSVTFEQKISSIQLINMLCEHHNIPKKKGDSNGGIIIHNNICNTICPGNYPYEEMLSFLRA
jgi:N-acetylmuramoyl-L-alanine amidase CwlA